jgi:hypothetical protein
MFRLPLVLLACTATLVGCGPAQTPAAAPEAPPAPIVPPPPPADPTNLGPQDARDDLYCGAAIFAAYPTPASAMSPTDQARLQKTQNFGLALSESGFDKLYEAGLVHATHAAAVSQAYADLAAADLAADALRIPIDQCVARSEALPPVE